MGSITFTVGQVHTAAEANAIQVHNVVRVHLANVQSINNNSQTVVKFDTVDEDTDSGYSASTGMYTVATAGLWLFEWAISWASNATGNRTSIGATSNNTNVFDIVSAAVDGTGRTNGSLIERLAVNATFDVQGVQTSGGALNVAVNAGTAPTHMRGVWLGP